MIVAALKSNLHRRTSQIRGTLSAKAYANPELNVRNLLTKCVETIGFAPQVGGEIVRSSRKLEPMFIDNVRAIGVVIFASKKRQQSFNQNTCGIVGAFAQ